MAKPNVVLIAADRHRWDCCGFTGHPDVRTPNLDALAAHGVVFRQAVTTTLAGAAARASLLTGLYPSRHGIVDDAAPWRAETPWLPRLLKTQGYMTAAVGEVHARPVRADIGFDVMRLAERHPDGRNVDDYHGFLKGQGLTDLIDEWETVRRRSAPDLFRETLGAMRSTLPQHVHSTAWIGDQAVRFIQGASGPFFLYVGFGKPGPPFDPPAPWDGVYNPRAVSLPRGWRRSAPPFDCIEGHIIDPGRITEARFRRVAAFYYGNISFIDKQVGRILATLAARGVMNTLIIYTAGRGDCMGQHGLIGVHPSLPYDGAVRTPLIVSGLAGQRQSAVDDGAVTTADIAPTVLACAGAASDGDGTSLTARLCDGAAPLREAAVVETGSAVVARTARAKRSDGLGPGREVFFLLDSDPEETDNQYGRVPEADFSVLGAAIERHRTR